MGHLSDNWTTSHWHSVWPVRFKSRFIPPVKEEQPHWTWRDLSFQTLFIWWIHLLERFERCRMVASHGINTMIITRRQASVIKSLTHFFTPQPPVLCVLMFGNLKTSQVDSGSTLGVVSFTSCSLSQGQFGQPAALTPPKQAVTANPPPSLSNPRQSWANPKLIQRHSQLGVSHSYARSTQRQQTGLVYYDPIVMQHRKSA